MDLDYLLFHLNEREPSTRFSDLNKVICELIEDYSLVGFSTLCITDKHSVANLLKEVDKANGYIFGALSQGNESILMSANSTDLLSEARDAQMRYETLRDAATNTRPGGAGNTPLDSVLGNMEIIEHRQQDVE
ncbi:hypothetical protein H4S07_006945 [Coemansia furcata]|uniref:Uncharacterized protein n=1 Tax=Coemansia furcata TaxID=417177 RepID=A0ACC1KR71_9FUNG|nr:hypothetical protein H4S07_006945 [Coemansia furcata]